MQKDAVGPEQRLTAHFRDIEDDEYGQQPILAQVPRLRHFFQEVYA